MEQQKGPCKEGEPGAKGSSKADRTVPSVKKGAAGSPENSREG